MLHWNYLVEKICHWDLFFLLFSSSVVFLNLSLMNPPLSLILGSTYVWRLDGSNMSLNVLLINFAVSLSSSNSTFQVSWAWIVSLKLSCCWYYCCVSLSHREGTHHLSCHRVNWETVSLLAELLLHFFSTWMQRWLPKLFCMSMWSNSPQFLSYFLNTKVTKREQVL